jgi:hypothetical protein
VLNELATSIGRNKQNEHISNKRDNEYCGSVLLNYIAVSLYVQEEENQRWMGVGGRTGRGRGGGGEEYKYGGSHKTWNINHLTPKLNPSAQRCLTRFFTGDFAPSAVNFVNTCVKNQQIHQLFIQFINYVW